MTQLYIESVNIIIIIRTTGPSHDDWLGLGLWLEERKATYTY